MENHFFRRKTGILGGTFNPIHNGHIALAKTALEAETLDEVILMPSGQSYLKSQMQVLDAKNRYEMVKLAVKEEPFLSVSDMEIKRPGNTYTYETLLQLKETAPHNQFYFIVGADNLFSIENWKRPEEIFANCILLAAVRDNKSTDRLLEKCCELKDKFQADIRLLPFENTPISSTQIRERVSLGQSISDFVPEPVETYIHKNQFYLKDKFY